MSTSRGITLSVHLLALSVALLGACTVVKSPLTINDLIAESKQDRNLLFANNEPLPKSLTLAHALARALKYNLDHRVKLMEEALSLGQLKLDKHDLLPKMINNAGYSDRSEANASTSVDYVTKAQSSSNPSYSSDRATNTADLTISWNILDFGISYYSAKQDADRALITAERRRKALHNLVREVRFAYWRAASAQVLHKVVQRTIQIAEKALSDAHTVASEGLKKPIEALRYKKTLLENLRQLESVSQELATAHIELAALINVAPGTKINVQLPPDNLRPPALNLSIGDMEELAFQDNPDIREQSYHTRIALKETKKAILSLLPGITLTGGRHFDGNDLLQANRWFEWSSKLTWNVFNILNAQERIDHAETSEKLAKAQRLALRMAILAQVHVAETQFRNAEKRFKRADQLSKVDAWIADLMAKRQEADAQSVMDRVSDETSAITSELRRYQAYAELEAAFGQLHATLGIDILPEKLANSDLETLAFSIDKILDKIEKSKLIKERLAYLNNNNRRLLGKLPHYPPSSLHKQRLKITQIKMPDMINSGLLVKEQKNTKDTLLLNGKSLPSRKSEPNNRPLISWLAKDLFEVLRKPFVKSASPNKRLKSWEPIIFSTNDKVTFWAVKEKKWAKKELNGQKTKKPSSPDLAVASP